MEEILGSGIAFPLQVDRRGGIALASDVTDVDQAIQLILGTAPGERPMRPEFGCRVNELVFDSVDALTAGRIERDVRVALDRWEPRIDVLDVRVNAGTAAAGRLDIDISYRLRASNDVRNLVYPFYVIPEEEPA
jgi:phage baseplate assembly protein W